MLCDYFSALKVIRMYFYEFTSMLIGSNSKSKIKTMFYKKPRGYEQKRTIWLYIETDFVHSKMKTRYDLIDFKWCYLIKLFISMQE